MNKYEDNPDADGTDFAHPAFWRGNDAAVSGMIGLLRRIKSGKETKMGKFANPELTELRDWIIDLRDNASSNRDNVLDEIRTFCENSDNRIDVFYRTQDGRELESEGVDLDKLNTFLNKLRSNQGDKNVKNISIA